jgi:2'-5' RNA ligase
MQSHSNWPDTDRLRNHWSWRPEWSCDRPCLWWYLTFEDSPQIAAVFGGLRSALSSLDCVHVVPPRWLHLTLCEVGFADEVPADQVDAAADAVAEELEAHPPLRLSLGPLMTFPGAVALTASPLETLRCLRVRVQTAMVAASVEAGRDCEEPFWPHVSLGYVNQQVDRQVVMNAVGRTRPSMATEVTTASLTLAAVTRRDSHYQWSTRTRVTLAGDRGSSVAAGRG